MSGHSKWSTIKRQKGVTDARRGQLFTKLAREIMVAVREGGASLEGNFRLRLAVQKARDNNMPLDNIERAIKKGSGQAEGASLVEMVFEGYGPGGTAILAEALSDNRNRVLQEVRHIFSKHGGNLGESGCVAWLFDSRGVISVETGDMDAEELALQAIDTGAEDVKVEKSYV
jgi:YebC/PmpR family DNA-binding regulatory protein